MGLSQKRKEEPKRLVFLFCVSCGTRRGVLCGPQSHAHPRKPRGSSVVNLRHSRGGGWCHLVLPPPRMVRTWRKLQHLRPPGPTNGWGGLPSRALGSRPSGTERNGWFRRPDPRSPRSSEVPSFLLVVRRLLPFPSVPTIETPHLNITMAPCHRYR